MKRRAFDRAVSVAGLALAILLLTAGGLLTWASTFVHDEVHSQLAAQKIFFPPAGSDSIAGPEFAAMQKYAGQQLVTGEQAKTYANHFIAVHLQEIGGGKTYAQLSAEAQANPKDTQLAEAVNTMFKGETLRGLLLNAYAFDTMGNIAGIAAWVAFAGGGVMLILVGLGFLHAGRVAPQTTIFAEAKRAPADRVAAAKS